LAPGLDLGGDGDAAAAAPPLAPSIAITELTDTQSATLCTWLANEFAIVSPNPPLPNATASYPPGFAGGPGLGCGNRADGVVLNWVLLSQQNCVSNLHWSPCAATVGALTQCIDFFVAAHTTTSLPDAAPVIDCSNSVTPCDAFESAPSCDQTVIQAVYSVTQSISQYGCAGAVPIEAGATCDVDAGLM
jgi:hypothetical protein